MKLIVHINKIIIKLTKKSKHKYYVNVELLGHSNSKDQLFNILAIWTLEISKQLFTRKLISFVKKIKLVAAFN